MGYLCMQKPKIDRKKLGALSKVTPSSVRTVHTKGRRTLEKWEETVISGATKKAEEHERIDEDNPDEAVEAAHVEDTEN
ncbi:hypothetical protein DTO013E5_4638 [Penicillium roqueforti]|uniref:uncharacterized protein n=1 Tax=Penicillium roqueforti TaxID=5082 RepID=UPI00190C1312|nr:uncharacterized protein LCP9604111_6332 [Penicillium roqueforti]KAF9247633.1 hypothetical protein LCP9604111_6332 [Penicillium roqueforti]KAI1834974.1 hypothetical protein CBS147337_4528 [Penicillium roqueforti]KAI2676813.1 hypothetical protein CBS147355_5915 [Penicillium roqueforti]KAI2683687.1 hypothetical protein LCP963914a_6088 [Penicillium roqueforti]KAI2703132.1 hypothetical protein CBS147372_3447 [Penicillium roqueforti]